MKREGFVVKDLNMLRPPLYQMGLPLYQIGKSRGGGEDARGQGQAVSPKLASPSRAEAPVASFPAPERVHKESAFAGARTYSPGSSTGSLTGRDVLAASYRSRHDSSSRENGAIASLPKSTSYTAFSLDVTPPSATDEGCLTQGGVELTTPTTAPLTTPVTSPLYPHRHGASPPPVLDYLAPRHQPPDAPTTPLCDACPDPPRDPLQSMGLCAAACSSSARLSPLSMPLPRIIAPATQQSEAGRSRAMSLRATPPRNRPPVVPTALMPRRKSVQSHLDASGTWRSRGSLDCSGVFPRMPSGISGWELGAESATSMSEVEETVAFQGQGLVVRVDQHGTFCGMNELVVLSEIASGATAIVHQVCDLTESMFAMKCVSRRQICQIQNELECLQQLSHPGVPRLHQVVDCAEYPEVFLIMEFVEGGPVCRMSPHGLLEGEPWPEDNAQSVFRSTLEIVEYLHEQEVMHRDIKPDNIMYDRHSGRVVLIDYGTSFKTNRGDDSFERTVGTPFFLPPEASMEGFVVAKALDLWALAVVLYLLLVGKVPYGAGCLGGRMNLAERVADDELRFDCPYPISREVQSLLAQMLDKDLACRPTMCAIKDSPWMTGSELPVPLTRLPTSRSLREQTSSFKTTETTPSSNTPPACFHTGLTDSAFTSHLEESLMEESLVASSENTGWMLDEGDVLLVRETRTLAKVLIADPCYHSRRITKALLTELVVGDELDVEFCSDGEAALRAYDAERRDLVLIDLHVPRLSGLETALRLRQKETHGHRTTIIALAMDLTAVTDLSPVFCEAGVDGALRTPLNWKALHSALRQAGFEVKSKQEVYPDRAFLSGHQFDLSYRRRSSASSVSRQDWLSSQMFASHAIRKMSTGSALSTYSDHPEHADPVQFFSPVSSNN